MKTLNKIFTSTILLAAIILTGCFQDFHPLSSTEIPAGKGMVKISIAGTEARTLFPDMTLLTYSASFTNDKGDTETFSLTSNEVPIMLTIGIWTLNIEAKNSEDIIVGEATINDVEVIESSTTEINDVLIKPVRVGEDINTGTLIWKMIFPDGLDEVMLYTGNNVGVSIKNTTIVDGWRRGEIDLMPDSYLIRAVLTKGSKSAGNVEAVHIFSGMETVLEWELNVEDDSENMPTLHLTANASTGSAYDLIEPNGFRYESPSQNNGSIENALFNQPQIIQIWDDILVKNVFRFNMIYDTARNATGDWTRQRLEVLVNHTSNSLGRDFVGLPDADEGRSLIHRWKFKLPADFAVSGEFTHLHQIKNEGGSDAGNPIVTLTARRVGTTDRMQLIYRAPNNNGSSPVLYLSDTGAHGAGNAPLLSEFRGHWVQVEETITYSSNPAEAAFSIKITRIDNSATLLEYTHTHERYAQLENDTTRWPFVTWRTGNTHGRPKFGLYRRINTGDNPGQNTEPPPETLVPGLKDETILFADFEVIRVK